MRLPKSLSFSIAAAALLLAGTARAEAPQVLALLAAPEGIPVQCHGDRCSVELATLCLQPERLAPKAGQSYALGDSDGIELMLRRANGSIAAMPLPAGASIEAVRTHVAVRLSFPAPDAGTLAGVRIAGTRLLLPAGAGAGANAADVDQADDERLPLMRQVVAADAARTQALILSRRLINDLAGVRDAAGYDRIWQRQAADLPRHAGDWRLAEVQRDFCRFGIDQKLYATPADCLRAEQDGALEALYDRYVEALATGS